MHVILALCAGIPRMVAEGNDNVLPLHGGSPLREDDGGEGNPPASTVCCSALLGGFHGVLAYPSE